MPNTLPSKEEVVLKLLAEGDTMVCLDARLPGVQVPPQQAQNPALRLVLNLNFPHPINVTAEGVSANLSFGGRRFACYIPMEAVWAAYNPETMEGTIWPESAAPEVLADLKAQQEDAKQRAESPATPGPQTVPSDKADAHHMAPDKKAKASTTPRQRGHLRLIK